MDSKYVQEFIDDHNTVNVSIEFNPNYYCIRDEVKDKYIGVFRVYGKIDIMDVSEEYVIEQTSESVAKDLVHQIRGETLYNLGNVRERGGKKRDVVLVLQEE